MTTTFLSVTCYNVTMLTNEYYNNYFTFVIVTRKATMTMGISMAGSTGGIHKQGIFLHFDSRHKFAVFFLMIQISMIYEKAFSSCDYQMVALSFLI